MRWLEVSLTVEEELVEPVADVLSRFAPGGVAMSPLDPLQATESRLVTVHAYLEDSPQLEDTRREIERSLWYLGRIRPFSPPEFRWIEGRNWEEAWKDHFKPMLIGRRLRIQPAWLEGAADDRQSVLIDPGMAFGTGAHPTTQLCLELLEEHVQADDLVTDLGCGSGILGIAAIKLGAARCLAYDIEAQSVTASRQNARLNQVGQSVEVRRGSLDELMADLQGQSRPRLVIANIFLRVLCDMLDNGLGEIATPGGLLIVSGILAEQTDELAEKARFHNLRLVDLREREDWRAMVFQKENPPQP